MFGFFFFKVYVGLRLRKQQKQLFSQYISKVWKILFELIRHDVRHSDHASCILSAGTSSDKSPARKEAVNAWF